MFAKRWSDDMRPAEKGEYNKAVDEANSAAVNAANEAIRWLDLGNTLRRAPKPE